MLDWDDLNFKNLVRLFALLGFIGLAFGCGFAILGKLWWVFELAAHFMLPLLMLAVLVTGLHLCLRSWKLAAASALLLVWILIQVTPYLLKTGGDDPGNRTTYRFVVLNLLLENQETDQVLRFLESEEADVLLLQEVTPRWERRLREALVRKFPHRVLQTRTHAFGIWLLSKHPLNNVQVLPSEDANIPYLTAAIDLEGRRVNFVGVHPLPPVGQSKARARNKLLSQAGELIGYTTGPRILLGDLNTTPWSPYFRQLLRDGGLRDSGRWHGWDPTWNPGISWLQLPIDHCLVSEEFGVADRRVGPAVGSDHRGVVVDVFFNGED